MKKLFAIALVAAISLSALTGCSSAKTTPSQTGAASSGDTASSTAAKPKIGVVQYLDHPSLNTIRDSFTAQMTALGYKDGDNCEIEYKSAGGDATTQNSIVQSFAGAPKDIIIAIATPTAQAAATVSDKIPVIFSAVSYPVEAELVKSLEAPGGNITGTSDEIQVELILDLARKYNPNLKKLGIIYNKGEANSTTNLAKAKAYCEKNGLELIEATIANTNEVQTAAQVLCSKVDAVFAPNDNTVASAMPVLSDAAIQAKIPVYCGADSMVNDGGFATIGINYEDLGKETANMADQVIKGKKPGDIPVKVFKDNLETIINPETAKALGLTVLDN